MLPFYSLSFVMLLACAVLYYRIGQFEGGSGIVWAGGSILISVFVWQVLGWRALGIFLSQAGLFFGISVFRTLRTPRPEHTERSDGQANGSEPFHAEIEQTPPATGPRRQTGSLDGGE